MIDALKNGIGILLLWAVALAIMLVTNPVKVWRLAGGSWLGVLMVYAGIFLVGAAMIPLLAIADWFEAKWIRFFIQLAAALLVASLICAAIVFMAL